jgi:RHS repeat-associated protein
MKTTKLLVLSSFLAVAGCSSNVGTGDSPESDLVGEVTQAASTAGQYAYGFDKAGLSTSVGNGTISYAIARTGDTLKAGGDTYRYDALGRVNAINDLAITVGPTGQIARATRGAKTIAYVYDENGDRILKSVDGVPSAAYVDGVYVTPTVRVGGKLVGLLRNGRFAIAPTDARGTVLGDTDGTSRLPSPFGARPVHPDVAAAFDYTEKGFDADLGAIRMGVRDYDPRLNRFLTPDPLYLEHPEKCVEHLADCTLYAYARNSPAMFTDPTGKDGVAFGVGAGIVGGTGDSTNAGAQVEVGIFFSFGKDGMRNNNSNYPSWRTSPFFALRWRWSQLQVRPYVSVGTVSTKDKGTGAVGASAGVGGSGTYIRDDSQFMGNGASLAVTTPVVGFSAPLTTQGAQNGFGVSAGPGRGGSGALFRTTTWDIIDTVKRWLKK